MISIDELTALIQADLPDAEVKIIDKNGMSDHYIIFVRHASFEPMSMMDRHRKVMAALKSAMNDGRLHAAEIQTAF